jgi:hypothetical protein
MATEIVKINDTHYEVEYHEIEDWAMYSGDEEDNFIKLVDKYRYPSAKKAETVSSLFQVMHTHCSKQDEDLVNKVILAYNDATNLEESEQQSILDNIDYSDKHLVNFFCHFIGAADKPYIAILPVYLMDHSSVSISTSSFNDKWDSGKFGYIYRLLKEGDDKTKAIEEMKYHIQEIDDYFNNNIIIIDSISQEVVIGELEPHTATFVMDDICEYANKRTLEADITDRVSCGSYLANKEAFVKAEEENHNFALHIRYLADKLISDHEESLFNKPLMDYIKANIVKTNIKNIIDTL